MPSRLSSPCNGGRGAVFLESQFRVRVQVPADYDQAGLGRAGQRVDGRPDIVGVTHHWLLELASGTHARGPILDLPPAPPNGLACCPGPGPSEWASFGRAGHAGKQNAGGRLSWTRQLERRHASQMIGRRVRATLIVPVILSGGSGTRLWPVSRESFPKQLWPLVSNRSLIQETALRATGRGFAAPVVVCNEEHRFLIAEQLREAGIEGARIPARAGRPATARRPSPRLRCWSPKPIPTPCCG